MLHFKFELAMTIHQSTLPLQLHLALRLTISFAGFAPWNYANFLDYCTERLFLQRVGGGYRFIHRFLQEHLATQYEQSLKLK